MAKAIGGVGHLRLFFFQGLFMAMAGAVFYGYWFFIEERDNDALLIISLFALVVGIATMMVLGNIYRRRSRLVRKLRDMKEEIETPNYSNLSTDDKLKALEERYRAGKMDRQLYENIKEKLLSDGKDRDEG